VNRRTGLSPKRLLSLFRDEVGLSSKRFWRVRRFHAALRDLNHRAVSGATLAAAHGYFDQARFQREFLALTGLSPRERLLPASERCRLVAKSALDLSWLDQVDGTRGVFVFAQGLFMCFDEGEVKRLFVAIVERFPGVELMFDTIPPWLSKKTLKGFYRPSTIARRQCRGAFVVTTSSGCCAAGARA
jgi:AraC-like DNA-binding protein